MDVPWNNELYNPEKGNRFEAVYDDGYAVYDNETRLLYHTENDDVSVKLTELMNEQQSIINILLEELVNAQQQGYVIGFLHKNGRCNLTPKELEDE